ncbi:hypothetical protein Noda2021_10500 [Candidatus Dependentiae bacterium Noda2021]|nr:hypothetical protein Noda2021_10500 [Candidatus Dependentiae bacterium Noda2021]
MLSVGMEKITLYDHAYNGNYSSLKERITDNDMTACDEYGSTLFMHAVVGVFAHKKYDNFQELIRIFKKHTFDFNAPAQGDSLVSNICFVANISMQCRNLIPLEIAMQEGANPFFGSNSVYENMLTLAMNDQLEAFKVAGLMAQLATNIHDAAKSVCLASMIKQVSPQTVNLLDAKQRSPLFYLIQYGSLAPKTI